MHGPEASLLPPLSLRQLLPDAAARFPEAVAIDGPEGPLSYARLHEAVRELSAAMRQAGLAAGERVAVAATRSQHSIVAILAAVDAGLAYVPLDPSYPEDRLRAMLTDAAPRAVLGSEEALAELRALVGAVPTLQAPAAAVAPPYGAADDLTYVLFTSGSTGRPKGVAMGHAPLAHLIAWHRAHARLGQAARTAQFAPLSFDVHFQEIFSTVACGGTLVLLADAERRDPARLLAVLRQRRVERLFMPYVALQMLAEAARGTVLASLREVVSAGEQLNVTPAIRALFAASPGAELHNHYGPTETHVVTAFELAGDPAAWPEIPAIGKALPHVQVALRAEDGGCLEGAAEGELLLGGDTLAHGYLGRADLSAERFLDHVQGLAGRWYCTGDLVQRAADGVLTYLGRIDQQLKVDGFRIEPGEIELALMAQPAVREAVVAAPKLPGAGQQLVAYVVPRDERLDDAGARTLFRQLREELRARLPAYMVPVRFMRLERLPTTPSGKIDRRGLPLPEAGASARGGDVAAVIRTLWQELLGVADIDERQNLFDIGARSLLVLRFVAQARAAGIETLSVTDVYEAPTLRALAARATGHAPAAPGSRWQARPAAVTPGGGGGIAIVGMAVRAAGAPDLEAFWRRLVAGEEGITHFSAHELDDSVPAALRSRPNFVPARGVLEDAGRFDAGFFGISPREAVLLDPQQRLLLELAWNALEHASIDPARGEQRVGVYAGTANNSYAAALRDAQPELVQQAGEFAAMLAAEKDYVATRVAHRLDLRGPAVSVHTACSTGLVAVAQAWHALQSGQCDVALAGGATVLVPQEAGYLHVEGGMESADGHCRPFDAKASGTVFGSAGAVVVLKRLDDALADGDTVHAIIRGVGLNNDGADKASFTAPSVRGQAGAIREALERAGVSPRSIGYVEAHGTGTALGDPIEIAALTQAWRADTPDTQFCTIGSLKSNFGHTVAAAGVLGLVKATLALQRETIPGTLHFEQPNPHVDFVRTPFRVGAQATPWPRASEPRRAAVSSFGVGGTNAHVIIEEPPVAAPQAPAATADRRWVLPLSARTAQALQTRATQLALHLEQHPGLPLAPVAATLMRGRQPMPWRLAVVAADALEAAAALRQSRPGVATAAAPRIVFLFPGQGSQHPGMARGLYNEAPAFREALDRGLALVERELPGVPLRHWLLDSQPDDAEAAQALAHTLHAQPALLCMGWALAAWLESLGVRPDAMIGHSIGEYAAACRAGVFTLEDAVTAVLARARAMASQPAGAMLAVRAGADTLRPLLGPQVEIAGVNAPELTVLAGPHAAIEALVPVLEARALQASRLKVSHAFHSASMEGAQAAVAAALAGRPMAPPRTRVYSCISGAELQAAEATDAAYWARQVRAPVQFSRAVQAEMARDGDVLFVEVGPAQALSALVRQHRRPAAAPPRVVPLLGPAQQPGDAGRTALAAVGALWCAGVEVAWPVAAGARRCPLPGYPFAGETHWFRRRPASPAPALAAPSTSSTPQQKPNMSRLPRIQLELRTILGNVSGIPAEDFAVDASFVEQGLDSLSLTQATLEIERVFGVKLRLRRLMEDLASMSRLAAMLDAEMPAERMAEPVGQAQAEVQSTGVADAAAWPAGAVHLGQGAAAFANLAGGVASAQTAVPGAPLVQLVQQQVQLMAQQLALLAGQPAVPPGVAAPAPQDRSAPRVFAAAAGAPQAVAQELETELQQPAQNALIERPFGAAARITLGRGHDMDAAQQRWLDEFIARYNARTGRSKSFSQQHREVMADPRVVTGFNPKWKDLVYPIVVERSSGARLWDLDGNEYIDLLNSFGANLLGYGQEEVHAAMVEQLRSGIEVGPQHPLAAEVAGLIARFTGLPRVAFCNTGSEAVMGAMRIARTVTGRKTIAIFTNSYHGIFDEVIVRGTKQLRSVSAAPGILASAVENVLVLDWASEASLRVLRERAHELAAIMTEPIQNKVPTVQPRDFVRELRRIADDAGCALIFDEVVTGFRVAPGGAQEFYGVRADIATYGKVIGGGLPFAAIAGGTKWLDALDGGQWRYGDDSYPEAGVTYFAGTFVRHPLALAAARAALRHLERSGRALYDTLNGRTQALVERLNAAFALRGAPVKAVHCASLWRLAWDEDQRFVSLFYYLARLHGLHLYEQFGHFTTEAMQEPEMARIFEVFTLALDELMALGFITPRTQGPDPVRATPPASAGALGPGQTERWLAAGFDEHARRALNESFCVSLRGPVDLPALKAALHDVVQRHDAFRLRFELDEPRQVRVADARLEVHEVDLRQQADADAALDAFCTAASAHDFPLERAPLAALSVVHLADGRTVVHMVASHLVFDGWASSVFNTELAAAYRARCAGQVPRFEPAESPIDFAREQNELAAGPAGQEASAHWAQVLRDPPPPLALGDRTPPNPRQYRADTLRARIDGARFDALMAAARHAGATTFQWLLAALARVLRRRAGRDDFVVSIPYAAQNLGRHGPLVGDGVLDLPLRLRCPEGAGTEALLPMVRAALIDAMEHPLMTQGTAARALGLRAEGHRPPLSAVFFNLNPKVDLSGWAPLRATMHEGRKRGLLSELFFNFYEQPGAITFDLHHSTEHFSPQRVQELVDELVAACVPSGAVAPAATAASATPAQAVSAGVTMVSAPVQIDARLLQWNATDRALEPGARIETWVRRQAAATPQATAVVTGETRLSYSELQARADRFAQVLRARGIAAGSLVGLCLDRGPELLPALLGVLQTGAAYVPLDPGFPRERLRMMAEDAALPLVITQARHAELAGLPRERQLRVDDDAAVLAAAPAQPLPPVTGNDTAAYVIYTSGSTGKPKGVAVPQRAVCNFLASMLREPGLGGGDTLLAVTTLSFDIAVLELLGPLVCGATVVLARRDEAVDGETLARLMGQHRVNVMQATPTTWHLLLDAGWRPAPGFRALCGGEPLPPALAKALLATGLKLWNLYGPTETTVWSTLARIEDAERKVTIGRPIDNTQVWICDEAMRPLPVGAEGEIVIGGKGVALGYHEREALTRERFVAIGFGPRAGQRAYRTGDLGRWNEEGQLEHLGRLDFQVKVRGYRIELGEIEAQLEQAEGIARAVVVAHEASPGDVALVGYVVPRPGAAADAGALREGLRRTLPEYMLPRTILVLASLPLLPNGKVDRKSLPLPKLAAPVPATPAEAAAAPTQADDPLVQTIATHMGQLLGRGPLGRDDHFFEQGGHSLMAAKLSAALSAVLGRRPGLRAIFEHPTPAGLAEALRPAPGEAAAAAPAASSADVIPRLADPSTPPLSQMQQRVWFLENLTPGTVVHSIPTGHRLTGPLDLEAFDRAWQMLVKRQSALRTVIERTPTGDVQRVREDMPFTIFPVEDLTGLPEGERKPAMAAAIARLVETPYDLERGPLFTVKVFRISPEEHGMLFQAHHLIWDAWSFDLLYVDLPELYSACLEKREPRLPEITVSYGDFAAWHNQWMSGEELRRQTGHWRDKLTPLPPALELPLDRPRPPEMSGRGGSFQFNLAKDVTDALREQARRHGRTLYVTLLAAYAVALHRTTMQDDFVVGTPVRGREQPALEPLMGFFVNMLPLRMRLQGDPRLSDWLTQLHGQVVESFSYPDVPFDHLVRELNVPRDASRPPIHQVSFSYQDVRERTTRWGNVDHARMPTPMLGAAQDLALWCVETRNHVEFVFTFNADVLDTATVGAFGRRLEALLRQVLADPDRRLSQYDMLSAEDRQREAEWNATAVPLPPFAAVHEGLAAQCARTPQAPALVQGEQSLTHAELHGRARQLARALRAQGIGRGALVGLCLGRTPQMVVAQLAVLYSGAAYVPLDPAYPAERLAFMAEDARLALLVTDSTLAKAVTWPKLPVLRLDADAAAIAAFEDTPLAPDVQRDARATDAAYVIYTSGSTGKPKGVVVPHRAVVNFLHSMAREPGLGADDTMVAVTTLSFDIAVLELLLPLWVGARIVLASREQVMDGHELRKLIEGARATVMQATPSSWRMLLEAGWQGHAGFKALVGGEALPVDLAEQLLPRCAEVWNMYGPTETTVWSTCWRVQQPQQGIRIGRPIANTRVHVLDERRQPCGTGVPGEICIGGEGLSAGYLYRAELTADRFIDDPAVPGAKLYRTGDLGRWRLDGQLEHLGRLDFQVKVRGHRIELGEIEAALAAHADVARNVVTAREDTPGDVRLVAYVVPRGAVAPEAGQALQAELRRHLLAQLPEYMVPQHFVVLAGLPLLPNGKLDRKALPAPAAAAQPMSDASAWVAPATSTEKRLAAIWAELLKVDRVGANASFMGLGGHSMLLMRMSTRLNAEFKAALPLNALFDVDELRDMARLIDESALTTH